MKAEKNRKSKKQVQTVDTLQQFKELYFPSMTASEKKNIKNDEENYGDIIAMSILDGIKSDLSILRK